MIFSSALTRTAINQYHVDDGTRPETAPSTEPRSDLVPDPTTIPAEDDDLYSRLKSLQRQLEFIEIQEEYVKDEQKNLKRELLRAQEEVKRIQSVPLVIGQFMLFCMPNVLNYNILINGSCMALRIDEAKQLFDEMSFRGLIPNTASYNTLISGLFQVGRVLEAKELFKDMHAQGCSPNRVTYSILVDGLSKQGYLDQALELFREMQNRYLNPDLVIYNILIDAMCKSGKLEDARELFLKLYVKGLLPDVRSWTSIISGLCREGLLDEAYKALRQMERDGCRPDDCSYNVIVRGFIRNNGASRAEQLFQEMFDRGFPADAQTRTLVADLLSKDDNLGLKRLLGESEFCQGSYLKFNDAIRNAYPDIKIISNCDGSSHSLDHPVDYYDFQASVSDYAVTGNDAGTGSLLATLADTGLLIGLKRNRWNPDAIVFNSSKHCGTLSYWVQKLFRESNGATLLDAELQTNSSTLVASAITWRNLPENKAKLLLSGKCIFQIVNFGNSKVILKVSIDGLGLNSQLSVSTKTVLTSSNLMDENSFTDPKKVVPAQTLVENADEDMDVVLTPYSLTSFDLLTESNSIRMPQTDSFSRSSI